MFRVPYGHRNIRICSENTHILSNIFNKYANKLYNLISSHSDTLITTINTDIRNNPVFNWARTTNSPNISQQAILLCHNLIPTDLTNMLKKYFCSRQNITNYVTPFIENFTNDIYVSIWKPRSIAFKAWKSLNNINRKSFQTLRANSTILQRQQKTNIKYTSRTQPVYHALYYITKITFHLTRSSILKSGSSGHHQTFFIILPRPTTLTLTTK